MHKSIFEAVVIVLGFALAAGVFGQTPEPSPGDGAMTRDYSGPGQTIDLLWWIRY